MAARKRNSPEQQQPPEQPDEQEEPQELPPPPTGNEQEVPPAPGEEEEPEAPGGAEPDAQPAPEPSSFDLNDVLGKLSPKDKAELRKHPLIAGIAGDIGQRRAQELFNTWKAQQDREREEREAEQLLENDPDTFIERERQRRQQRQQEQGVQQQIVQAQSTWQNGALGAIKRFQDELPEEVQAVVSGKRYAENGTFDDGLYEYIKDVSDNFVKHQVKTLEASVEKKLRPKLERELREKILEEIREEQNASEPSPGTNGTGRPAGTGAVIDQKVWDANRHNRQWRLEHKAQINEALEAGRIRS